MSIYTILVIIIAISAIFGYINQRFIKMPFVIGIFFLTTLFSLVILSLKFWDYSHFSQIKALVKDLDISKYILEYMLGYLLFAGALHTDWIDIKKQLRPISLFAVFGVMLSTIIVASLTYGLCTLLSIQIDYIYCLLFGALISPTDPIAVLGILTKANVPKKIEATIVGESLFNDGVGVVIFIALLEVLASDSSHIDFSHFGILFVQESFGGILFGLAAGFTLHKILTTIDHYQTEVLLTLAFVMVGYSICLYLHISGALAMVIMGLFVGNYNHSKAMSDTTIDYVDKFWELLDVVLNAILFVIISFVIVVIELKSIYFLVGICSIFIVLLSRVIIVYLPKLLLPKFINLTYKETKLIVWGGLRGGLSLALVLSLPDGPAKNLLLIATYVCVVFSILVQGLTIGKLAKQ
ncbi:MAG: sodium:proton antiporter [Bacteroidota bacterium]|nr:sodium:proton antiporter [Bacteroidota bacterium]